MVRFTSIELRFGLVWCLVCTSQGYRCECGVSLQLNTSLCKLEWHDQGVQTCFIPWWGTCDFKDMCMEQTTAQPIIFSLYYADWYLIQHRARFRPNVYHYPLPPNSSSGRSQQTSCLIKGPKWVWKVLKRGGNVFIYVLTPCFAHEMEQQPDTLSTSCSAGWKTNYLEMWFKGCHSGVYFIRAMSSESIWVLELDLWSCADRSQRTLRYNRCWWGKQERHYSRLECAVQLLSVKHLSALDGARGHEIAWLRCQIHQRPCRIASEV